MLTIRRILAVVSFFSFSIANAFASDSMQIGQSEYVCVDVITGFQLLGKKNHGPYIEVSFEDALSGCVLTDQKTKLKIKRTKKRISAAHGSEKKKLKAFLKILQANLASNADIQSKILACQNGTLLHPNSTQIPTSSPTPKPTSFIPLTPTPTQIPSPTPTPFTQPTIIVTPAPTPTPSTGGGAFPSGYYSLLGGAIIAADGHYLGQISANKYDSDSIGNTYGTYGNKYSSDSILNKYGNYGGKYSSYSPFNPYTSTPPVIIVEGGNFIYLTANKYMAPRVDPYLLLAWLGLGSELP